MGELSPSESFERESCATTRASSTYEHRSSNRQRRRRPARPRCALLAHAAKPPQQDGVDDEIAFRARLDVGGETTRTAIFAIRGSIWKRSLDPEGCLTVQH